MAGIGVKGDTGGRSAGLPATGRGWRAQPLPLMQMEADTLKAGKQGSFTPCIPATRRGARVQRGRAPLGKPEGRAGFRAVVTDPFD